MKLSEIVNESISVDPLLGFNRKASAVEFYVNNDQIDLVCLIKFFENGEEVKLERLKPYTVRLSAQNSTLVNPANGKTVEDGENEADCIMGEYDYLITIANNPLNIFDVMKATIAKSDLRGRFNK